MMTVSAVVRPLPQDAATNKQKEYLGRLVSYRLEAAGVEVPSWKGYPVATNEQVTAYIAGLLRPIASLDELSRNEASNLIHQLKQ